MLTEVTPKVTCIWQNANGAMDRCADQCSTEVDDNNDDAEYPDSANTPNDAPPLNSASNGCAGKPFSVDPRILRLLDEIDQLSNVSLGSTVNAKGAGGFSNLTVSLRPTSVNLAFNNVGGETVRVALSYLIDGFFVPAGQATGAHSRFGALDQDTYVELEVYSAAARKKRNDNKLAGCLDEFCLATGLIRMNLINGLKVKDERAIDRALRRQIFRKLLKAPIDHHFTLSQDRPIPIEKITIATLDKLPSDHSGEHGAAWQNMVAQHIEKLKKLMQQQDPKHRPLWQHAIDHATVQLNHYRQLLQHHKAVNDALQNQNKPPIVEGTSSPKFIIGLKHSKNEAIRTLDPTPRPLWPAENVCRIVEAIDGFSHDHDEKVEVLGHGHVSLACFSVNRSAQMLGRRLMITFAVRMVVQSENATFTARGDFVANLRLMLPPTIVSSKSGVSGALRRPKDVRKTGDWNFEPIPLAAKKSRDQLEEALQNVVVRAVRLACRDARRATPLAEKSTQCMNNA